MLLVTVPKGHGNAFVIMDMMEMGRAAKVCAWYITQSVSRLQVSQNISKWEQKSSEKSLIGTTFTWKLLPGDLEVQY